MQIDIKENEMCRITVSYTADALEIMDKRAEVLSAFKRAPVPGFRPNKANLDAIKHHYKDQIEESLKHAMAEKAYHDTVFEHKLRPLGSPRFNSMLMLDGKFTCEFDLNTKPDFQLAPYNDLSVPLPHLDLNIDVLTEAAVQDLRMRFGEVEPFSDTDCLVMGDNAIIDYESSVDGQRVDALCGAGEMINIGKSPVPEFDTKLQGMMVGETREFDVLAPATSLPSIANKMVHFKITLSMGSRTTPAALDDELAKKLGCQTFAEVRTQLQGISTAKVEQTKRQKLQEAVANRLVDDNQFEVPNWLALSEAQYLTHQAKLDWNLMPDQDKEKYLELGSKNVKLALVLDKVREVEPEAQLTDQEVFEIIKRNLAQQAAQSKTPVDDMIKEMQKSGYLQVLMSRIRDEFTLDHLMKSVKVAE